MAKISMDPEKAISYGKEIIENASSFSKEVSNIYSIIGDLKANWTGSAAQRYTDNIESFKEDYQKFGKLINDFGNLLVAVGNDYKKLEETL